jgi:hypothetical protein
LVLLAGVFFAAGAAGGELPFKQKRSAGFRATVHLRAKIILKAM